MNRQNRRHPTHPLLPLQYPTKERIVDRKKGNSSIVPKGYNIRKRRKG